MSNCELECSQTEIFCSIVSSDVENWYSLDDQGGEPGPKPTHWPSDLASPIVDMEWSQGSFWAVTSDVLYEFDEFGNFEEASGV